MKYYVVEIQNSGDSSAHLVHTADTRLQAESVYHQVLSYAAISTLESHAAILFTDEGQPIMHQCYMHETEEQDDGADDGEDGSIEPYGA